MGSPQSILRKRRKEGIPEGKLNLGNGVRKKGQNNVVTTKDFQYISASIDVFH